MRRLACREQGASLPAARQAGSDRVDEARLLNLRAGRHAGRAIRRRRPDVHVGVCLVTLHSARERAVARQPGTPPVKMRMRQLLRNAQAPRGGVITRVAGAVPSVMWTAAPFVLVLRWAVPLARRGGSRSVGLVAAWIVIVAAPFHGLFLWRRQDRREQSERLLELAQRRLSAVVQTGDELLWEMDALGNISYLSPIVRDYLGYRPEELLGQHVGVLLPERERERAMRLLTDSASRITGWTNEHFTFLTKAGRPRVLVSSGVTHVGSQGVVGFTGTVRRAEADWAEARRQQMRRDRVADVIERRAVQPVFQPIIDLATGAVVGAEALSRFPDEPEQDPEHWFNAAAAVGLGQALELLALRASLEAARRLPPDIYVSINVSPATLRSADFLAHLQASPLPATRLVIEVTEHASVADYPALSSRIGELRARGLRLAVDDAGSGYASFQHILQLVPDYIKLDRTLVGGLDRDPARHALVSAVSAFARDAGFNAIAEGIETSSELDAVRVLGLAGAQGFYLGRPAPAEALSGTP